MTKEEKQLLLKDLCARLPDGVMCQVDDGAAGLNDGKLVEINISKELVRFDGDYCWNAYIDDIKPYLRPMSSMTEEEEEEYWNIVNLKSPEIPVGEIPSIETIAQCSTVVLDWLLSKGFDVRGLIPMGLALEAPNDMYNL